MIPCQPSGMKISLKTLVIVGSALILGLPTVFTDMPHHVEAAVATKIPFSLPSATSIQTTSTSTYLMVDPADVPDLTKVFEKFASRKAFSEASSLASYGDLNSILTAIAKCESDLNPKAKNPTSSAKGLLQIIDGTWQSFACDGNVLDPHDNMRCGVKIATKSGLHHWDESKFCWIKRLPQPIALK